MFKLKSTADKEFSEIALLAFMWKTKYETLMGDYDKLLHQYEKACDAIDRQKPAISADDTKRLIQLCHPDKHNGSVLAKEMTQKLLSMRVV